MVAVFTASSAQQINLHPVKTDISRIQEHRNCLFRPHASSYIYKQVLPYTFYHAITTTYSLYNEHFTTRVWFRNICKCSQWNKYPWISRQDVQPEIAKHHKQVIFCLKFRHYHYENKYFKNQTDLQSQQLKYKRAEQFLPRICWVRTVSVHRHTLNSAGKCASTK